MTSEENPLPYIIHQAEPCDIPEIRAMQTRSMWALGAGFYSETEIAGFMQAFGTMDDCIVFEGHCFVARDSAGAILASGAWSRAKPGYAAGLPTKGQTAERPTVRSVFVDPGVARRGIGSAIMRRVEQDAASSQVPVLGLTATLSGVPLYQRLGYDVEKEMQIALPDATMFGCVKMKKSLAVPGASG